MEKSNPELEASLDALAKLCCDAINRQNSRTVGIETSTQSTEFDTTIDA